MELIDFLCGVKLHIRHFFICSSITLTRCTKSCISSEFTRFAKNRLIFGTLIELVLNEKLNEIEKDKQDIEDYNKYVKAYKIFEKNDNINLIDPEYLVLLFLF